MIYALLLVATLFVLSSVLLLKNYQNLFLPKWVKVILLLLYLLLFVSVVYGILFVFFFGLNLP